MIYWSIVALEDAMQGFADANQYPELHTVEVQGALMEVEFVGPFQAKIHRLLSPVASDYLKPEWMPGQIIQM